MQQWDSYVVEPIQASDFRAEILALWHEREDDDALNSSVFQWFLERYPFAGLYVYGLFHDVDGQKSLIGIQALIVRNWLVEGEAGQFGNACALVVGRHYRSLGPALKLVRTTLGAAPAVADFFYSFPNRLATPLFKRAGSLYMDEMARYSKPLKTRIFFERHRRLKSVAGLSSVTDSVLALVDYWNGLWCRRLKYEVVATPDQRFDVLWQHCEKQRWVIGDRGSAYLGWRLSNFPRVKNRIVAFYANDPAQLSGYVAYYVDTQGSFFVEDFLARDGVAGLRCLLIQFILYARKHKAQSISAEFFGDQAIVDLLRKLHFYKRDVRPIYTVSSKYKMEEMGRKRWYVTHLDEDQ